MIFGRNDLVQDAPISRLDLLICRNTLMYFTAETQGRILRRFHFALRRGPASLMLGKSEMMVAHRELFTASDVKHRIFVKQPRSTIAGRASAFAAAPRPTVSEELAAREGALESAPQAQVIVSRTGRLTFVNLAARALFQISREDIGRPFSELLLARRPVELEPAIAQALRERSRVPLGELAFTPDRGDARRLEVIVTPLLSADNVGIAVSVTFADVTRYAALQSELEGNRRDLELAYEELQSTIDELETTNEELQSANEELQTTNEELQSTNEELETMNEELQSTNEELETINDELRERTGELNQVNDFLEAILTSLGLASPCSTSSSASRSGTGTPRSCGACVRTRPSRTTSSASTWPAGRAAGTRPARGAERRQRARDRRAGGRQPPRAADRLRGHRAAARGTRPRTTGPRSAARS